MYAPNAAKNTTFTFLHSIKKAGEYEVFFYCITFLLITGMVPRSWLTEQ
jgi:hypothetical protein